MTDPDPHRLHRFVEAQASTWPTALAELRAGAKRSHWMWFIFPQIAGLGQSDTARRYAIAGPDEARAYLTHPTLGPRLREATGAMLGLRGNDPVAVLGGIDATKLRSPLTLFDAVEPGSIFADALDRFYGGERDEETLRRL